MSPKYKLQQKRKSSLSMRTYHGKITQRYAEAAG